MAESVLQFDDSKNQHNNFRMNTNDTLNSVNIKDSDQNQKKET